MEKTVYKWKINSDLYAYITDDREDGEPIYPFLYQPSTTIRWYHEGGISSGTVIEDIIKENVKKIYSKSSYQSNLDDLIEICHNSNSEAQFVHFYTADKYYKVSGVCDLDIISQDNTIAEVKAEYTILGSGEDATLTAYEERNGNLITEHFEFGLPQGAQGYKGDYIKTKSGETISTGATPVFSAFTSDNTLRFNIVLPQGVQGEAGTQGINGVQGTHGEHGQMIFTALERTITGISYNGNEMIFYIPEGKQGNNGTNGSIISGMTLEEYKGLVASGLTKDNHIYMITDTPHAIYTTGWIISGVTPVLHDVLIYPNYYIMTNNKLGENIFRSGNISSITETVIITSSCKWYFEKEIDSGKARLRVYYVEGERYISENEEVEGNATLNIIIEKYASNLTQFIQSKLTFKDSEGILPSWQCPIINIEF